MSKQGIRLSVSRDHIAGSSLELTEVSFCFFKLTDDQVLVFDWIAGSTQVNSPKHKRGFIFRVLSVARRGYTAMLRQLQFLNSQSFSCSGGKKVWKMFSCCIFRWFQSSSTYHDSCGPHWRLRSYSSQASEGKEWKGKERNLI